MGEGIRRLLRGTSSHHLPGQIAAAVALGVLGGLLPKFNLSFGLLTVLCFVLPVHLPLAAVTCLLASGLTAPLSIAAGHFGLWSLTHPWLKDTWLALDRMPFLSWFGLYHSSVHGSLLMGLILLLPIYLFVKPIARRLTTEDTDLHLPTDDRDFESELRPAVAQPLKFSPKAPLVDTSCLPSFQQAAASPNHITTDEQTFCELQSLLASCTGEEAADLTSDEVAQRAAQMAEYVDDLLNSEVGDQRPKDKVPNVCKAPEKTTRSLQPDDTVSLAPKKHFAIKLEEASPMRLEQVPQPRHSSPMTATAPVSSDGELLRHHDMHVSLRASTRNVTREAPPAARSDVRPEEALRYLLHHLKAIQDKV